MTEINSDQATDVFLAASNLNAALKSFLKREVQKGDPREKFVKSFRKIISSNNKEQIKSFLEQQIARDPSTVLGLAGYAHSDTVTGISQQIIDQYAEKFNECYETSESSATITDQANFDKILKKSAEHYKQSIKETSLPDNHFMSLVFVHSLFEDQLIEQVIPYFN